MDSTTAVIEVMNKTVKADMFVKTQASGYLKIGDVTTTQTAWMGVTRKTVLVLMAECDAHLENAFGATRFATLLLTVDMEITGMRQTVLVQSTKV